MLMRQCTDHWQDVLIGSIVGLAFAYFSYRQYFPPLNDKYSHLPYRPRIDWDDEVEAIQAVDTVRRDRNTYPRSPEETDGLPFAYKTHRDKGVVDVDMEDSLGLSPLAHTPPGGEPVGGGSLNGRVSTSPGRTPPEGGDEEMGVGNGNDLMKDALEVDKTYPAPSKKANLGLI
jgi:hypothetical protein